MSQEGREFDDSCWTPREDLFSVANASPVRLGRIAAARALHFKRALAIFISYFVD